MRHVAILPSDRALRKGMTLIELMIVLGLAAALFGLAAYGLGMIGRADVRGESLRLSSILRFVYNESVTQNRTLQLVIDLDQNTLRVDDLNISGALSADQLAGKSLLEARAEEEANDPFARFRDNDDDELGGAAVAASASRGALRSNRGRRLDEEDTQFVSLQRTSHTGPLLDEEQRTLKDGVYVLGVMTSHHEELQTEGIATINFFPNGFVERAIIYLGDEEARDAGLDSEEGVVFTIMVNPLTGQSTVKPGMVPVQEKFFEPEEDD